MVTLALRNLLRERTRLAISVGGIAFAVTLIVLVRGLFVAYQTRVADYFDGVDTNAWVMQSGTADFFHSFSLLPTELRADLADIPGVDHTTPYVARLVALEVDGTDTVLYLVGYDPADPITGPQHITEGTAGVSGNEIVIDEVFAAQHSVDIDDTLTLEGTQLTVAGISTGGDLVMFQYAFVRLDTARNILDFENIDNAILLNLTPGTDAAQVRASIESDPNLQVRSPAEIVKVNQRVINDGFLPVIKVLLAIGFIVGVAVVGLTIYSSVSDHRNHGPRRRHPPLGPSQPHRPSRGLPLMSAVLSLDHVTKTFTTGSTTITAVDHLDLRIAPGELVIIMGPSGSGKSTLLQIIGALLSPTSGTVELNGRRLDALSHPELADLRLTEIGFIFSRLQLARRTQRHGQRRRPRCPRRRPQKQQTTARSLTPRPTRPRRSGPPPARPALRR